MLLSLVLLLTVAPPPPFSRTDDVAALEAEFAATVQEWRESIRAAEDVEARRKLRSEKPAARFWPRFQPLADAGEGRALLWMARNAQDAGLPEEELSATRQRLVTRLFEKHLEEAWFQEVLRLVVEEKRKLGLPFVESRLSEAAEKAKSSETRAAAMVFLGELLMKSKDEAERNRGAALLERVAKELPETRMGRTAGDRLFVEKNLVVGAVAPDFEGRTIDGKAFELSDFRGKVVVLEFFGFW